MSEVLDFVPKVFRWSFSQWEVYNVCPFKWKCQSVLMLPRAPGGPHADRGTDMHDRVESYIKGEAPIENLLFGTGRVFGPTDKGEILQQAKVAHKYIAIIDEFREHPNGARHTELKLAFDFDWSLVPSTHPKAACIMVLDAVRAGGAWNGIGKGVDDGLVRIGEWKSGKPKDTHADQRKMYAMAGLKNWLAKSVEVTTYYLEDTAPPARLTVADTAWPKLTALWTERRDLMIRDEICAPRPGFYCRWCEFANSKGGPCRFS